jgi:hypothetical protein
MQSSKETLQYLLKGSDPIAQQTLDDYFAGIPDNPNILWYPGAGIDFRDLTELSAEKAAGHGVSLLPDLFIHTDCSEFYLRNGNWELNNNEEASVKVKVICELALNPEAKVRYFVNPKYYLFAESAPAEPVIRLLDITRRSEGDVTINGKVIYFFFENNNFLDEFLLRFRIGISHLVKVGEAVTEGDCLMSVTYVLDFLSVLGTKYLIYGDGVGSGSILDFEYTELDEKLFKVYGLKPHDYTLIQKSGILQWSRMKTRIFEISYLNAPMSVGGFMRHMNLLGAY